MTFVKHFRVVARFNLGHATIPKETASCTLNFRHSAVIESPLQPSAESLQDLADEAFDDWATFLAAPGARFLNKVFLNEVRVYWIGTDGRAELEMQSKLATEPIFGNATTNAHPWQVSTVLTLFGEDPGPGRYGRIFLPPQAVPIDNADGCYSVSDAEGIRDAAKTFVESISDKDGIDINFALAVASGIGAGKMNKVEEIRVGRVPDTQRRRRRDLDENYVTVGVST